MFSLYRSHDRELLYHGTIDEARAAGIRYHAATNEVTFKGQRHKILNRHIDRDYVAFWIAS